MSQEYLVLSNFGTRYFLEDYVDSTTIPATGSNEVTEVISCNIGKITKDSKKYKTLNGGGWDSVALLGQSLDEATMECVRGGTGDAYVGEEGLTTYTKVRDWITKATANNQLSSAKVLIECIKRGDNVYEGTAYMVFPSKWDQGNKNSEDGQIYSFSVAPFGPPISLTVTHVVGTDIFSFTASTGTLATSITVTGAGDAATITADGGTLQMSAEVLPSGASDTVTWTVVSGTGTGTISAGGLLTAVSNGTVSVVAHASDGSGVTGNKTITISGQV